MRKFKTYRSTSKSTTWSSTRLHMTRQTLLTIPKRNCCLRSSASHTGFCCWTATWTPKYCTISNNTYQSSHLTLNNCSLQDSSTSKSYLMTKPTWKNSTAMTCRKSVCFYIPKTNKKTARKESELKYSKSASTINKRFLKTTKMRYCKFWLKKEYHFYLSISENLKRFWYVKEIKMIT